MKENELVQQNYRTENKYLSAQSLLTQSMETHMLPPERFPIEITGDIVDIQKINDSVVVLRKIGNSYSAIGFDKDANAYNIQLDINSHQLFKAGGNRSMRVLRTSAEGTPPSRIALNLGYGPQSANKIQEGVFNNCTDWGKGWGYTVESWINNYSPVVLPVGEWSVSTVSMNQGKAFLFKGGDTIFIVSESMNDRHTGSIEDFKDYDPNSVTILQDLKLVKAKSVFRLENDAGTELAAFAGSSAVLDPTDKRTIYYIQAGQIYKLDTAGVATRTTRPVQEVQIKIKNPAELKIDPEGNFLIIKSADQKLYIVDKESGEVAKSFEGVKGPIYVDNQGDIIFGSSDGRLREIQTNFQAIPSGGSEQARKSREEELKRMQERFASLELKKIERQKGGVISEDDVAQTLRETISRQVTEQISTAVDSETVEEILDRLQGLKSDPINQAYTEVIDEFVTQAREKLSEIQLNQFEGQLSNFQTTIDAVQSVGDTIGLDEQFAKLLELRQKIEVIDPQQRREIEQRLRTLQTQKDVINTRFQGELIDAANKTLPEIEQLLSETGSLQELVYFSTSSQAQQFEMMMVNIKDPKVRKELRDKYTIAKNEQRARIEERSKALEEQDRLRWAQIVEEAREDLGSLQEQIEQLSDAKEIDRFGRHPLVTAWRAKLFSLPPELREIEEKRLDIILGARKRDMEHRKDLGALGEAGELKFGSATFPIYKEPPRIWQPKFIPIKNGLSEWADLVFEDTQGRIWHPSEAHQTVVIADMNHDQTKSLIERYRKEADEHFKGIKRRVPDFDEHWRITDFHMERLEEIAEALNLQLANHRGITILQGEAGTGKNVLVDILGNLSNREVISIACNENSVKEDLTYEFYFDPGKGTYKLPSRMIEGLQTPGSIVLFDEINALKPGIAKMLNSLFDYRRRLYLAEGGKDREIIADPTTLFIGTMNPQNYAGVNRLSPEVKSRSRVIDIEYPPFESTGRGRTHYRSDEAEMLAAYMDDLSEFKQKEFKLVWDYVINRDTSNGADMLLQGNSQIEEDTRRIYDVIRVANRLREMYSAYQIGDSNEPMDFPTSLREVTDIVMEMNHRKGVKPMIKRVIIPKIDDRRQKKIVEETINAVLPD